MRSIEFSVDVIYNSNTEWHESFYIVLDEKSMRGAEPGDIMSTTVTVLDDEVSGSLVLPTPPVVSIIKSILIGFLYLLTGRYNNLSFLIKKEMNSLGSLIC